MQALLDKGASPDMPDAAGTSALGLAQQMNDPQLVQLLSRYSGAALAPVAEQAAPMVEPAMLPVPPAPEAMAGLPARAGVAAPEAPLHGVVEAVSPLVVMRIDGKHACEANPPP